MKRNEWKGWKVGGKRPDGSKRPCDPNGWFPDQERDGAGSDPNVERLIKK